MTATTAWASWSSTRTSTEIRSGSPLPNLQWDYTIFGKPAAHPAPDQTIDMVIEVIPGGPGKFNHWLINGKEYPHEREFVLKEGARYRLVFHNRSDDAHPVHMHRHTFELVDVNGKKTAGVIKDTVVVPNYGRGLRGLGGKPAGADAFSLPQPAAHGLWL